MLTSIGKYSKSFFIKVLVGIIILPFVFWGMGDVFRGGNQNIVATIDSEKISTQEFINFLNRLNLNDEERKNLKNTNFLERILSEYVGRKIIELEVKEMGIVITDATLKNIILNDKTFFKDNKFSRTAYEKFLITSSITAPSFERNIVEQEKKRQLLQYLSDGTIVPDFLIETEFRKENQIKEINYIDLNNYYKKQEIKKLDIEKIYNENKESFKQQFKSIKYLELTPNILTGKNNFDESFFKKINIIENNILDGVKLDKIIKENNFKFKEIIEINAELKDKKNVKYENINKDLFNKIFIKEKNKPELLNIKDKYYLAEVSNVVSVYRNVEDKKVLNAIQDRIKIKFKVENNKKIAKNIALNKFDLNEMNKYAVDKKLSIESITIKNFKDNKIFTEGLIKRIFETEKDEISLITDSLLSKNFIIYTKKTNFQKLDKSSKEYKIYKSKAKMILRQEIYETYDRNINNKYKVNLNNKVIERLKNTF